jgi:hypothetical protein
MRLERDAALERVERLEAGLAALLGDVEPVDHTCEPAACPMAEARRVLAEKGAAK